MSSVTSSRSELAWMAAAGGFGLAMWVICFASVPRYSYGAEEELGNPAYWWILLAAALCVGVVRGSGSGAVASALALPALVLAPWTAPRGDNDGLWVLIILMLGMFTVVLVAAAAAGAWVRSRLAALRHDGSARASS